MGVFRENFQKVWMGAGSGGPGLGLGWEKVVRGVCEAQVLAGGLGWRGPGSGICVDAALFLSMRFLMEIYVRGNDQWEISKQCKTTT